MIRNLIEFCCVLFPLVLAFISFKREVLEGWEAGTRIMDNRMM